MPGRKPIASPEAIHADMTARFESFDHLESRVAGTTDSQHGVIFGNSKNTGDVAVKPFNKYGQAANEASNYRRVAQKGFDTLTPIDTFKGDAASYLVTEYRDTVRPITHQRWEGALNEQLGFEQLQELLGRVALDTAILHDDGVTHGDYQMKNIAYDSDTGLYVVNDLERAQIDIAGEDSARNASKDLATLGQSLVRRGALDRTDTGLHSTDAIYDLLLTPYMNNTTSDGVKRNADSIRKQWDNEAQTRSDWMIQQSQRN